MRGVTLTNVRDTISLEAEIRALKEELHRISKVAEDDKFWHKAYDYDNLKQKLEKITSAYWEQDWRVLDSELEHKEKK